MNLLTVKFNELLDDYIKRCWRVDSSIEVKHLSYTAVQTIKHLRASKEKRLGTSQSELLMNRWYASLKFDHNMPDYSVYTEQEYLAELLACFVCYSRKHIKNMQTVMPEPRTVLDLGAGLGYTTAAFAQLYPNAACYYSDLKDSFQARFAELLADEYKFHALYTLETLPPTVDVMFASEYFEHFEEPVEHLLKIISYCQPRHFFIANSFTAKAVGHFDCYFHHAYPVLPRNIGRVFSRVMQKLGYVQLKTNFWNNRPQYWCLQDESAVPSVRANERPMGDALHYQDV